MWRVLVLLLLVESAGSATGPQPPPTKPQPSAAAHKPAAGSRVLKPAAGFSNVIIITLDTTRADRMDFLGSLKGLTPNLDALAKDGVVFTRAYSHVPLTPPSHATILTGT